MMLHNYFRLWRSTIILGRWEHADLIERCLTLKSYFWIKLDIGILKRLVYKRLGMVITRCKYSNALQVFSTTITKGVGEVIMSKCRYSITVKHPNDIITYWQHMSGVGHGYQYRLKGSGLSNLSHF